MNKYYKITFLYDSSSRVTQIKKMYKIKNETEQNDIVYEQFETFGRISPQSGFSKAMKEDAPEALFVKSLERNKNKGVIMDRTEDNDRLQLILIQGYRTIYMEKHKSYLNTTLFGQNSVFFCQWDNSGALALYSKYHSGGIRSGGEIFKREGGILKVSFVKGLKKVNDEFADFEIKEPITCKIKRNRLELPYKIITYYK